MLPQKGGTVKRKMSRKRDCIEENVQEKAGNARKVRNK